MDNNDDERRARDTNSHSAAPELRAVLNSEESQDAKGPAAPTFPSSFADSAQKLPFKVQMTFPFSANGEWWATLKNPPVPNQWEYHGRHSGHWYEVEIGSAAGVECRLTTAYTATGYGSDHASARFYAVQKPLITSRGLFFGLTPTIEGVGAVPNAQVTLYKNGTQTSYGTKSAGPDGKWSIESQGMTLGENTLTCRQTFKNVTSDNADPVKVILLPPATILSPSNNAVIFPADLLFNGTCQPGSSIIVVNAQDHYVEYTERETFQTDNWQLSLKTGATLSSGSLTIEAQYLFPDVPHGYSPPVTFHVLGLPLITAPAGSSIQDRTFTLKGNNGLSDLNSRVEVFVDAQMVGSGTVGAAGIWEVQVTLKPGNHSLAVEQIASGKRTERGAPRAFKIRPAKIDEVKVDIIDKSITFSGIGYPGATVVITISGWPVTLPQTVVAEGGEWEVKATGLALGKHRASVLQKVPDNANGWIESLPYTFEFNNSLPDVYAVSSTDDYQPTFRGKGFTGATVKLFNPGGASQAAPEVVVRNGEWQSKASQQWGPTLNREVHIKQFLDEHQSLNWVKHPVTIAPLAPTIEVPVDDGLSPTFRGTCWPGAGVDVRF
ncbi:hypothetical protein ICA15_26385, partial [Pseudomonas sp. P116]|nr:hypothetical protein [Pseudomonas sp. P9(2020)]MBZ9565696.1 hypothetical protein [Pseudomonas sp. P116]